MSDFDINYTECVFNSLFTELISHYEKHIMYMCAVWPWFDRRDLHGWRGDGFRKKSLTVQSHHHISVTTWKEKASVVSSVTSSAVTPFILKVWMYVWTGKKICMSYLNDVKLALATWATPPGLVLSSVDKLILIWKVIVYILQYISYTYTQQL